MRMKPKIVPITVVSVLLGLVFDWLFYSKIPGVSVFIYASLILGFMFYLAGLFRSPLNKSVYWLAPVILFFSLMAFVRANPFLAFLNIVIVIYLLMLAVRLMLQPGIRLKQYDVPQYFNLMAGVPLRLLKRFLQLIQKAASSRPTVQPKSSVFPIIRGLILSLPVLFIFLLLLSSADLVFKEYLTTLFDFSISAETIFRWGLIGFVASWFTSAYALIFMPSSASHVAVEKNGRKFDLGAMESSIILGSVSLLFFAFVAVQLTYLFGGSQHIASTGYTYAEYARKGFFELIAVAAISLVLIWIIKKVTNFHTGQQANLFKWLSGLLIVEVMLIMLSAHLRLNLYEEAYGFTTLRLMSHLFIFWLAAAFVLLLANILRGKRENQFAFHLFISALCFFMVFNLINPDAFIARQNINRFYNTGKLDLHYLNSLSEDAVPEIAKLLDHPDEGIRKSVGNVLYNHRQILQNQPSNWQSANMGRRRTERVFREHDSRIEDSKLYIEYPEKN